MKVLRGMGLATGVALIGMGVWFCLAPDAALAIMHHEAERLPLVMGGRYAFFGVILIAALLYQDHRVTGFLLLAFGGLAFFDTAIYWSASPLPHLAVGVLCIIASAVFFRNRAK